MAAIDYSCKYTIVGPDGTTVSFNDDTDGEWCGYTDDITGLDCAEVRENAQNKVAASGGLHDNFYAGRLPWTIGGTIQPSILTNAKQELIQQAVSKALAFDGKLLWTPTGETIERMVAFRNQQPVRIVGRIPKTFQLACVGADYRILSSAINDSDVATGHTPLTVTVNNHGNEDADVRFLITGPVNADKLILVNDVSGKQIQFLPGVIGNPSGYGIPNPGTFPVGTFFVSTNSVTFDDFKNYNVAIGAASGNKDQYAFVDPLNTDWSIAAVPGTQTFTLHADGTGDSTSLTVQWRDSWI
jgi:hypothetical protein